MKVEKVLECLIYCSKCHKSKSSASNAVHLYIAECMHILCSNCIDDTDFCRICSAHSHFIQIDHELEAKLTLNATESFVQPIETCMFQLSAAMNLILFQKSEINKYKMLLKRAKNEIERVKSLSKQQPNEVFNGRTLLNLNKQNRDEKNLINDRVNKVYHRENNGKEHIYPNVANINRTVPTNVSKTSTKSSIQPSTLNIGERRNGQGVYVDVPRSGTNQSKIITGTNGYSNKTDNIEARSSASKGRNYLLDMTNANKKKKFYTDSNMSEMSMSSARSVSRMTINPKESEFKYAYRRNNRF